METQTGVTSSGKDVPHFGKDLPKEGIPTKTCRVALVNPGFPDAVIKIYPAEHETEKVLMDRNPGIERWEDIERLMNEYGPRNKRIPRPIPLHSNPTSSIVPDVGEDQIPLVRLQGLDEDGKPIYLHKPEKAEMPAEEAKPRTEIDNVNLRIDKMELMIQSIAESVKALAQNQVVKNPAHEEPVDQSCECPECGKNFKTAPALAMHLGRFHPKKK